MLEELVKLSNRYGKETRYVLVGGGNSSWKDARAMYIKGSGTSLATIGAEGFVGLDRAKLAAIMVREYDRGDEAKREAEVLADMMAARLPGSEEKRPSVETLLHNLFTAAFVLHLHPTLVNGMTCGARGEEAARELFGGAFVWIPEYRPGYELAKLCEREIAAFQRVHGGRQPQIIFLQNHGVFVAADTAEQIDAIYADIMEKLGRRALIAPIPAGRAGTETGAGADVSAGTGTDVSAGTETCTDMETGAAAQGRITRIAEQIQALPPSSPLPQTPPSPKVVLFANNPDIAALLASRESFAPLSGAFTPDHIVYCKAAFLYLDGESQPAAAGGDAAVRAFAPSAESTAAGTKFPELPELPRRYAQFAAEHGYEPRVICVSGLGAFFAAGTRAEAENARALFLDAVGVALYSKNFGGPRHLSRDLTDFITHWEIEAYRSKVAQAEAK